nr:helix-turn-helix transcriptional regulator [Providencia sp. PROV266]
MFSDDLIALALKLLSCSQKDLASDLNVSPTQISKWKRGEYMSQDMEELIRQKLGIGDLNPSFILLAGSVDNTAKWQKLISYMAGLAAEYTETGYVTAPLVEETEFLACEIIQLFVDMGVKIPDQFPSELDIDFDDDENDGDIDGLLDNNQYTIAIKKIFNALNDVYGFYVAYVDDLMMNDSLELYDTDAVNIEPRLLFLAATKVDMDISFAPKFREFVFQTNNEYTSWINTVKNKAFQAGIPLRAELLNLVHKRHDELGHEAEAESLGINNNRIHPDIYMNEILTGIRLIHQVLPKIMEKLEIDDFVVDNSDLRLWFTKIMILASI